jgi:hypothetical protein
MARRDCATVPLTGTDRHSIGRMRRSEPAAGRPSDHRTVDPGVGGVTSRTADRTPARMTAPPERQPLAPRDRGQVVGRGVSRSDTDDEVDRPTPDDRGEKEAGALDWSGVLDLFQPKNARKADEPQQARSSHNGQRDSEHVEQQMPGVPDPGRGIQTGDADHGVDRAPERAHPLTLVVVVAAEAVDGGDQASFRRDTSLAGIGVFVSWSRLPSLGRIRRNG